MLYQKKHEFMSDKASVLNSVKNDPFYYLSCHFVYERIFNIDVV